MRFGLALLRTVVGTLFMGHGLQKLAGWFGGHGLAGTGQFFEGLGLRPGRRNALLAGVSETAGGALLAAGLLTPLGATMLSGVMITAIRTVHGAKGPWSTDGGYEYNLTLLAIVFALADLGPGEWSLDELLGTKRSGPPWALAQLGAGYAGSELALRLGRRAQGAAPEQRPAAAPSQGEARPSPDTSATGQAAARRAAMVAAAGEAAGGEEVSGELAEAPGETVAPNVQRVAPDVQR